MFEAVDFTEIDDVSDYLINESEFYRQTEPLRENYAKKIKKGIFDTLSAVKGVENHVRAYLKTEQFRRDYGAVTLSRTGIGIIAANILKHWKEEIQEMSERLGEGK